jgi:DNA-binding GntR family transcriptional regulator
MSNAVDRAYLAIRDDILSGKLRPGVRLREEELTRLVGVSRTPVREALRRLEKDGYAVVQPNRGAAVPIHTKRDIDEIFGLRALLEGHAARRAATRITPEALEQLERICLAMRELSAGSAVSGRKDALNSHDYHLQMTELTQRFNAVLQEASDNRRLTGIIDQLGNVALTAKTLTRYSPSDQARNIQSHEELVRALRSGHADWAEAAMRAYVHNDRQVMTAIADVPDEDAETGLLRAG